jgi:hypothetical protein
MVASKAKGHASIAQREGGLHPTAPPRHALDSKNASLEAAPASSGTPLYIIRPIRLPPPIYFKADASRARPSMRSAFDALSSIALPSLKHSLLPAPKPCAIQIGEKEASADCPTAGATVAQMDFDGNVATLITTVKRRDANGVGVMRTVRTLELPFAPSNSTSTVAVADGHVLFSIRP